MDPCTKLWMILFLLLHLSSKLHSLFTGHIGLISPASVYPCLDTFDLLVTTTNGDSNQSTSISTSNEMIQLIRVYATNDPTIHLRQFTYLREFKVPHTKLVKIRCGFFTPDYRYHCFAFVSMFKSNTSIALWTQPECKLTLMNEDDEPRKQESLQSQDESSIIDGILSPHGSSYSVKSSWIHEDWHELSDGNSLSESRLMDSRSNETLPLIKCRCNQLISYQRDGDENHDVSELFLEVFPCSSKDDDQLCLNSSNRRIGDILTELPEAVCIINLTHPMTNLKVQIVKILSCDISHGADQSYSKSSSSLIIRNGLFTIDPQLEVNNITALNHRLHSPFLRIEASINHYYLIRISLTPVSRPGLNNQLIMYFYSLHTAVWFMILLIALIFLAILIFLMVWLIVAPVTRRRRVKVQIVLLADDDDRPKTSTSFVDVSSLEQFSFDESGSLEMDYYDYEMHSTKASLDNISS